MERRRPAGWLGGVLAAALLFTHPLSATIVTSSLTGRVTVGSEGTKGVTVTVTSIALQQPRNTVTSSRGTYWLGALPPGTYDVTFSLAGHTTMMKRAVLELARVARVDAALEPSEDEESVTSTARAASVADTIPITSHFDDASLDLLPTGRIGAAALAPGSHAGTLPVLDGVTNTGFATSEETVDQITTVRGAAPVEWESFVGSATSMRTRSGGDDFRFTLRSTLTSSEWNDAGFPQEDDGLKILAEGTAGGRIVKRRLWFFAAAWNGEQAYPYTQDQSGWLLKLDAQPGDSHHLALRHHDTAHGFAPAFENDSVSIRYTGTIGPHFTSEIFGSAADFAAGDFNEASSDFFSARASYAAQSHILTMGMTRNESAITSESRSFFASDHWSVPRLNIYAGVRFDQSAQSDHTAPRVAMTWDLHGNGTRAIAASYGEYAIAIHPFIVTRMATLGYATAIGNSGAARIDVLRRTNAGFWQNELQLDARYRLFDRLEAGATYTFLDRYSGSVQPAFLKHDANVWAGIQLPAGSHEFGVTVLQHYVAVAGRTALPTGVALRYYFPIARLRFALAADATNVFLHGQGAVQSPRAIRFWLRARL